MNPVPRKTGKRRELQTHALTEGPTSPFEEHKTRSRAQGWARLNSLVPQKKFVGFRLERLPARAGKTSKRKLKRTMSEHRSFRNCRIYRRSRGGWREENPRERAKRFTGEKAAPPFSGHPEGGGGIVVGITYHRRAHSFPHYGKLFEEFSTVWRIFQRIFHSMENFLRFFPRYGKNFGEFSTLWKTYFHTVENGLKKPVFSLFRAVGPGLLSGARRAPCEP